MRIYLDMCCYNRQFDEKNSEKIILEANAIMYIRNKIRHGNFDLVTSFMLHYENSQKINEQQKIDIEKFFKTYKKIHVGIENVDNLVEPIKKIMSTGIKRKDATHLASAIFAECDYFLTVDERLLNFKSDKIKMINPVDFVKILEVDENVE